MGGAKHRRRKGRTKMSVEGSTNALICGRSMTKMFQAEAGMSFSGLED